MRYFVYTILLFVPLAWLLVTMGQSAPLLACDEDYPIPVSRDARQLWSAQLGRVDLQDEDGQPYVRLTFQANPQKLRFDRDASLRVRTAFPCHSGEVPLALDAEVRFSQALRTSAELHDVMLLGERTLYLAGAGVAAADRWTRIRIPIPRDAPAFSAIHFGAGSSWAREYPGATITMDVRRVTLVRARPLHRRSVEEAKDISWRDPDDPAHPDPRARLILAPGAPVYAVVDIPGGSAGKLKIHTPPEVRARVWVADWIDMEEKLGVIVKSPVRLLDYTGGEVQGGNHPHRFWIRLQTDSDTGLHGEITMTWKGQSITRPVEVIPLRIPESDTAFQIYYQNNEGWMGYRKYADYYANAPGHFRQLRDLGFTGIHIANEPHIRLAGEAVETDFDRHGRYWQRWPQTLGAVLIAARDAGFRDPPVWEGLRVFRRDDVWRKLQSACGVELLPEARLTALAAAILPTWTKHYGAQPFLAVDDEPGVGGVAGVEELARELQRLRAAGYRTYLTTHSRQSDSFHRLAPLLDISALHAEDVTAGSAQSVERHGGQLWLYNGGSMNMDRPLADRFFYGLYGWRAGAKGLTQWAYTRPSSLEDPLDLRTRLQADAQFYALPGQGSEAAATPGLLGLAAGIVDRRILDLAESAVQENPEVAALLHKWKATLPLPQKPTEYTPYHLQEKIPLHAFREDILRALVESSVSSE
jgi:hypothetical protein